MIANEARLLPTQKNELAAIVEEVGFSTDKFRWEDDNAFQETRAIGYSMGHTTVTDMLFVSVLVYEPSDFYCKFGRKTMVISPGEDELIQRIYPKDRPTGFRAWLTCLKREVGCPDLWVVFQQNAIDRLTGSERAAAALQDAGKHTAATELREATTDLSKNPPDLTGAVQHALAGLECVAREQCGDHSTFGKLLERYPDLFPKPLDKGIEKVWGFASEMGRHLQEGRNPKPEEAELLVGLATVCCTYLARKIEGGDVHG